MALQTSGAISLSQIQTGLGGANPVSLSEYYKGGSYTSSTGQGNGSIPTSGALDFSDFYGADNTPLAPPTPTSYMSWGDGVFVNYYRIAGALGAGNAGDDGWYSTCTSLGPFTWPGTANLLVTADATNYNMSSVVLYTGNGWTEQDRNNVYNQMTSQTEQNFAMGTPGDVNGPIPTNGPLSWGKGYDPGLGYFLSAPVGGLSVPASMRGPANNWYTDGQFYIGY